MKKDVKDKEFNLSKRKIGSVITNLYDIHFKHHFYRKEDVKEFIIRLRERFKITHLSLLVDIEATINGQRNEQLQKYTDEVINETIKYILEDLDKLAGDDLI